MAEPEHVAAQRTPPSRRPERDHPAITDTRGVLPAGGMIGRRDWATAAARLAGRRPFGERNPTDRLWRCGGAGSSRVGGCGPRWTCVMDRQQVRLDAEQSGPARRLRPGVVHDLPGRFDHQAAHRRTRTPRWLARERYSAHPRSKCPPAHPAAPRASSTAATAGRASLGASRRGDGRDRRIGAVSRFRSRSQATTRLRGDHRVALTPTRTLGGDPCQRSSELMDWYCHERVWRSGDLSEHLALHRMITSRPNRPPQDQGVGAGWLRSCLSTR